MGDTRLQYKKESTDIRRFELLATSSDFYLVVDGARKRMVGKNLSSAGTISLRTLIVKLIHCYGTASIIR